MPEFQRYVQEEMAKNPDERVFAFHYEGNKYWLKRPEKVKGVWRLLKPDGLKSFHHELATLRTLTRLGAPIAPLVLTGDNFFVLRDAGRTANQWIDDNDISAAQKQRILNDCAEALALLHRKNITHGRPALRDIAWQDGRVLFLDFESIVRSDNLKYAKIRDVLVFLHGMFRSELIDIEQAQTAMRFYAAQDGQRILPAALALAAKFRAVYYLLLPFKPIAKTDLNALYRLFEFVLKNVKGL